jgi:LacI family transcriptional regulator
MPSFIPKKEISSMATIKDVARLAGVGVGTASRVVSGNGSVAVATAVRVRKAIAELDFRPSHAARSLLSGSTQMIGVYIPVLKGTFYTPILDAINSELRTTGRQMLVAFGYGDGDARQQAIEGLGFLVERGCDGLVVMTDALRAEDLKVLGVKKSKLVMLNHSLNNLAEQCFTADHTRGGVLAAQSFLEKGHSTFAVITGPKTFLDNVARVAGFMSELRNHGIDATHSVLLQGDFSPESGWACAQSLASSGHHFTALFCANDEMAVGALAYFQHAGISVPGTISVMGYDDTHTAEYSAPQLTSVHIPWRQITLNGLRWLLNECYGDTHPVQRKFQVSVTWRESVAPAIQQPKPTIKVLRSNQSKKKTPD